MNDHGQEGMDVSPPDRKRWEDHVARWQRAEVEFDRDAAEGVRAADRLFLELAGASEGSPAAVVRNLVLKREYPLGSSPSAGSGADPNPLAALADLGRGVQESIRIARRGQAAARGISAARDHRYASADDLREAMELYRGEFSRLLGLQREALAAFKPGAGAAADGTRPVDGTFLEGDAVARATRERIIAEKLVRESMIPLDEAEEKHDRRRTMRWAMIQLVGSFVIGLIMLAVVIWLLSRQ